MNQQVQKLNSILDNNVIDPAHYKAVLKGVHVDAFDIIRAFKIVDPEQANALRYILRAHTKGDKIEQIDKASRCLDRYRENELEIRNA